MLTSMEMIVFSGLQGAGKTTFFNQRFSATHVRLSLDLLKTRNREDILLFACLAAQQPIVIDNTNPTAHQRARYAELAKAANFKTVLYFFDIALEDAVARNACREESQRVPEIGVRGTFAKLEEPSPLEPFSEMFRVTSSAVGGWTVTEISK
jgi:predicted kinase